MLAGSGLEKAITEFVSLFLGKASPIPDKHSLHVITILDYDPFGFLVSFD